MRVYSVASVVSNSLQPCGQAPLSMGFSRQEYWGGLPWPPPEALNDPGMEPVSLSSLALADRFFTMITTWKVQGHRYFLLIFFTYSHN